MKFHEMYNDKTIGYVELQLLLALYKDPKLISEFSSLSEGDFFNSSSKSLLKYIQYLAGINGKSNSNIMFDYLSKNHREKNIWEAENIIDIVDKFEELEEQPIEKTYDEFIKMKSLYNLSGAGYELKKEYANKDIYSLYEGVLKEVGDSFKCVSKLNNAKPLTVDLEYLDYIKAGHNVGFSFEPTLKFTSRMLNGLLPKTMTLVGASINVGKSSLMTQMALGLLIKNPLMKVLFISNEVEDFYLKNALLSIIIATNVPEGFKFNRRCLINGVVSEQEEYLIKEGIKKYNEIIGDRLIFIKTYTYNEQEVRSIIRTQKAINNVDVVFYDTLKSPKPGEFGPFQQFATNLYQSASENEVALVCAVQTIMAESRDRTMDLASIAGAKGISEAASEVLIMRELKAEEKDKSSKYYCNPTKYSKEAGKYVPLELDYDGNYRVLKHVKSRVGQVGQQILLKFFGGVGFFSEVGLVKCVEN